MATIQQVQSGFVRFIDNQVATIKLGKAELDTLVRYIKEA